MGDANGYGVVGRHHDPAGDFRRSVLGTRRWSPERYWNAERQTAAGSARADQKGTAIEFAAGRHDLCLICNATMPDSAAAYSAKMAPKLMIMYGYVRC